MARGSLGTALSLRSDLVCLGSDGGDVLRLRTLRALRDVEAHLLVLLEGAEPAGVDRGVVDEDVGAAAFLGDEAKALFGVEPLHGSGSHKPSLGSKGSPCSRTCKCENKLSA